MNASSSLPGSSRGSAASAAVRPRCALSSWRTFPQVNARRKEPRVDGARTPPNTVSIAPSRSRPMSSMLSAPAAMPATRHIAFAAAFAPQGPAGRAPASRPGQPGAAGERQERGQARVAAAGSGRRTRRASAQGYATIALTEVSSRTGPMEA